MDELHELAEAQRSLQRTLREKGNDLLASALRHWATAPPFGEFVVGSGLTSANTAVFVVWDSADSPRAKWPYLARLIRTDGGWGLVSLLSQCTSCFGSGLLDPDNHPCDTCLARGWGLRESIDFVLSVGDSGLTDRRPKAASRRGQDPRSAAATKG